MKTLIFLIIMALVISGMIVSMRKSQAKADLAKQESLERLKKERKEALKQDYVVWPVIVGPLKGHQASGAGSEPDHAEQLAMTEIEYVPPERVRA